MYMRPKTFLNAAFFRKEKMTFLLVYITRIWPSKTVWIFFKNSSILVKTGLPKELRENFTTYSTLHGSPRVGIFLHHRHKTQVYSPYRYCLPPGRSPGAQVRNHYLLILTFERRQANPIHVMQTVHVGSNQSVGFRTQLGDTYGQNTKCKVHFKV